MVTHRARDRVEKAEEAAALGAVIKRRQKDEHESYGWKSRDFRSGCRRFGKPHRGRRGEPAEFSVEFEQQQWERATNAHQR